MTVRYVLTDLGRVDAVCWSEESSSSANNDEPARSAINHYYHFYNFLFIFHVTSPMTTARMCVCLPVF